MSRNSSNYYYYFLKKKKKANVVFYIKLCWTKLLSLNLDNARVAKPAGRIK